MKQTYWAATVKEFFMGMRPTESDEEGAMQNAAIAALSPRTSRRGYRRMSAAGCSSTER